MGKPCQLLKSNEKNKKLCTKVDWFLLKEQALVGYYYKYNPKTSLYKTRLAAKQNYFQPRKRTELDKKTFSYIGPKIWQEVPFELKSLS